ncbi:hypothetical protein ASPZODRAFT_151710 [Penicilliopsis zonata CBS 506.65]|uniref:AAA+ ATPase domain-containing protein n=1 Tax=Penicilliopsis zonata CBS 506.65 TaxID=1073090 RepID=A0A1L9SJ60_9EURO|nr:hypothetical protein ASPZODRAFT_151710 [Penicilliopsis zonata CBS 506.65]OJJ47166.1 hypothetical protein ASPZODRAFT_151710 [Penicilliopsis zonata CBS 506.65]
MLPSMQPRLLAPLARPCRFVAHRRYPTSVVLTRRFHASRKWLSAAPHDPADTVDSAADAVAKSSGFSAEDLPKDGAATSASKPPGKKEAGRPYGSAVRRAMRNRRTTNESAPAAPLVPDWFRERNTLLNDGAPQIPIQQSMHQVRVENSVSESDNVAKEESASGGDGADNAGDGKPVDSTNRYVVAEAVWEELVASVKAGLALPSPKYSQEPPALKSHLILQYPDNDGIVFLDAVVKRLGHELGASVVTLDAQDIAELCSEQDLADRGTTSPIRYLGYEVYRPFSTTTWNENDELSIEGEGDEADEDDGPRISRDIRPDISPKFITIETSREAGDIALPVLFGLKSLAASLNGTSDQAVAGLSARSTGKAEDRWHRLVNEIIPSANKSPEPTSEEESNLEAGDGAQRRSVQPGRDVIIQIQDYASIQNTREGSRFLSLLRKVIETHRRQRSRVLLIGTVGQDINVSLSQDAAKRVPLGFDDQFSKTIVLTPSMENKLVDKTLLEDRRKRTMAINIRHLQELLRTTMTDQSATIEDGLLDNRHWALDDVTIEASGLSERYWTYSQVHRIATLALGCCKPGEPLSLEHISQGVRLMEKTDKIRNDWLKEKWSKASPSVDVDDREQLLKSLRKTCNTHEKKLLNGVVDAKSIRTTFADVHVPPETIDALKTLTSLSLIRPEAFTYGVLATDKIPGLLLYGPPGTGKTLLAKAVARESGATVLEVSGSEIYDMYVGEGEKNVKAIFTLAKKLSPCVVFIDEADAIFCSRTGASNRTSHRELINQFLREWDGMSDLSAFIMVATNRPFDLDDAVLRRLPRRLLVDLPTEQDRLAILQIHLKEETIDASVDLAELSRRTPLYSGSDLKNLCVAAALACVRDENNLAAQHQGPEAYTYPERRTLSWTHFERGMEEISASISEDMSSLAAIRKFDEQYGDRKGRRKKGSAWGFTPSSLDESGPDSARVRT